MDLLQGYLGNFVVGPQALLIPKMIIRSGPCDKGQSKRINDFVLWAIV